VGESRLVVILALVRSLRQLHLLSRQFLVRDQAQKMRNAGGEKGRKGGEKGISPIIGGEKGIGPILFGTIVALTVRGGKGLGYGGDGTTGRWQQNGTP
jgi:hypothetical protein